MNTQIAQHVAALVEYLFEISAADLRRQSADAHASLNDLGPEGTQAVIALDVSRNGGNWQRNLVFVIESTDGDGWALEVKIYNEEQAPIIPVAEVAVTDETLADVALALARAGRLRLTRELRACLGNSRAAAISSPTRSGLRPAGICE